MPISETQRNELAYEIADELSRRQRASMWLPAFIGAACSLIVIGGSSLLDVGGSRQELKTDTSIIEGLTKDHVSREELLGVRRDVAERVTKEQQVDVLRRLQDLQDQIKDAESRRQKSDDDTRTEISKLREQIFQLTGAPLPGPKPR